MAHSYATDDTSVAVGERRLRPPADEGRHCVEVDATPVRASGRSLPSVDRRKAVSPAAVVLTGRASTAMGLESLPIVCRQAACFEELRRRTARSGRPPPAADWRPGEAVSICRVPPLKPDSAANAPARRVSQGERLGTPLRSKRRPDAVHADLYRFNGNSAGVWNSCAPEASGAQYQDWHAGRSALPTVGGFLRSGARAHPMAACKSYAIGPRTVRGSPP